MVIDLQERVDQLQKLQEGLRELRESLRSDNEFYEAAKDRGLITEQFLPVVTYPVESIGRVRETLRDELRKSGCNLVATLESAVGMLNELLTYRTEQQAAAADSAHKRAYPRVHVRGLILNVCEEKSASLHGTLRIKHPVDSGQGVREMHLAWDDSVLAARITDDPGIGGIIKDLEAKGYEVRMEEAIKVWY